MKYYAVIDTNVFVSALLTKNGDAATAKVLRSVLNCRIIPVYHKNILDEYEEVLSREKFHLKKETIQIVLNAVRQFGVKVDQPSPTGEILTDVDDLIFYEVAMEKREEGSYLVTGNLKHYPVRRFIVTPAEMMDILEKHGTAVNEK